MPFSDPAEEQTLALWRRNLLTISGDATNIANKLYAHGIFEKCHIETMETKPTSDDKMVFLIETYRQRASNLKPLNRVLKDIGQETVIHQPNLVSLHADDMVKKIKTRLRLMCENVANVWGKLLENNSLTSCFVEPEIVEDDGQRKRKRTGETIKSYEQLFQFEIFGNRIVIEGDPGMGKTTYVNKLALDWSLDETTTGNSHFLHSHFSVVFLIPLRSLVGGKSETLAQAADKQFTNSGSWINNRFLESPSKCLLILDAFDEYDGSNTQINDIIDGKDALFSDLKVIITTRPSHIKGIKYKTHWLSITGLTTRENRQQFLLNQGWDIAVEGDLMMENVLSGLGTLWHTPLYLAMLCMLHKDKNSEIEQLD